MSDDNVVKFPKAKIIPAAVEAAAPRPDEIEALRIERETYGLGPSGSQASVDQPPNAAAQAIASVFGEED